MEERARRAVRACIVVGTSGVRSGMSSYFLMGLDDKWWFAETSLEGSPPRKDGDGGVLQWPQLARKLTWTLLPWQLPLKDRRDPFPRELRKFERQIQRKHPNAVSAVTSTCPQESSVSFHGSSHRVEASMEAHMVVEASTRTSTEVVSMEETHCLCVIETPHKFNIKYLKWKLPWKLP